MDYKDSYCTSKQLAIKRKENIDLSVGDIVLRLSNTLYVLGLIVNLISILRLWRNRIGVYFELFFNKTTFVYANNIKINLSYTNLPDN